MTTYSIGYESPAKKGYINLISPEFKSKRKAQDELETLKKRLIFRAMGFNLEIFSKGINS